MDLSEGGNHPDEDSENEDTADSDEENEEEGEDGEFIDVLDVLDGRGEPDLEDDDESVAKIKKSNASSESRIQEHSTGGTLAEEEMEDEDEDEDEEGEGEGEEEDEDGLIISGSDEEDANPSALDHLSSFVSGLETAGKRKVIDGEADETPDAQPKKRKRMLKDRTESGVESEFGARAAGVFIRLQACDCSGDLKMCQAQRSSISRTSSRR